MALRKYSGWCDSLGYAPLRIEPAEIYEYRVHLERINKPSTVSGQLTIVRAFYRFLVQRGVLTRSPAEDIVPSVPTAAARQYPDTEQLRTLWEVCKRDDERAIVGLLGLCGLKSNELREADVRDISEADGVTLLRLPGRAKSGLRPFVPLCEPLAVVVSRLAEVRGAGALVRSKWDTTFTRHTLLRSTQRIGMRAGLEYALTPQHLTASLRAIGIERGYGYAEIVRSIGEIEARRLTKWVAQHASSMDDHPALRLGRTVLGSGSESAQHLHFADEILRRTDAHPAAAAAHAGAVVERHLRVLMTSRNFALPSSPKLSAYGAALKQRDVIDNRALQLLNRMQDMRNAAAHGRFDEVSGEDARWLINNARLLIGAYPVDGK
ncbi:DUF4145 domain-containing protein [Microbacterium sp. dk485]|nr:DUF4145 domain-containing protein [Microbacterium sp. dk485]